MVIYWNGYTTLITLINISYHRYTEPIYVEAPIVLYAINYSISVEYLKPIFLLPINRNMYVLGIFYYKILWNALGMKNEQIISLKQNFCIQTGERICK